MVESLDELLELLETDDQTTKKSSKSKRSELLLDVNDILSLDFDDLSTEKISKPLQKSVPQEKIICCPTFIGVATAGIKNNYAKIRTCSALHCRDCDFPVSSFADYEWIGNVEYLFLRTNMPDLDRVLQKLKEKNGTIAYACHCTSFSTAKFQPLHETNLPWFCRGHFHSN